MNEPEAGRLGASANPHESRAMEEVVARLGERFPGVAVEVIEAAVRVAHEHLEGPVRDYVPVLVERAARDRIAAFADRPSSSQPKGAAPAPPEMASDDAEGEATRSRGG